ncbi:voltage-gated potassium channel [Hydrogenivirga caldilitoris]|uniref:Voltage-gated potassium channel n=1 Tax=Hydrogenivirga caldilitoris TaxID=246264 RepID=A0A497XRI9_9AQUI|nr:NAD-binding protein [Hydrogenivirga caldilitoris]RLJ70894.1 voltage-gated potassium channel [Hydrogenivirga caldilitoris]
MLGNTTGHTILIGLDRSSFAMVETLQSFGESVVAIETDEEKIKVFKEFFPHVPIIKGSPKGEEILERAGIRGAKRLLVNTPSDEDNAIITAIARTMNPSIFISSRVIKRESEGKLREAGANQTYSLEDMSGRAAVLSTVKPDISRFISEILLSENTPYMIDSFEIGKHSPVVGRRLEEFYNAEVFGILLAVVKGNRLLVNPPRRTELLVGDRLIVLGSLEQIENLLSTIGA